MRGRFMFWLFLLKTVDESSWNFQWVVRTTLSMFYKSCHHSFFGGKRRIFPHFPYTKRPFLAKELFNYCTSFLIQIYDSDSSTFLDSSVNSNWPRLNQQLIIKSYPQSSTSLNIKNNNKKLTRTLTNILQKRTECFSIGRQHARA